MRTLLNKIRKLLKDKRTRRFWSRTVSFVAALVVFVTTYALVLPAITMERQANCGLEAHQHTDDCFERQLVCTIPESPGHHHDESCYTMRQEYSCTIEEHVHEEWCYDEEGNLICEIPEHSHEEGTCWQEVPELTCTLEESDGHQHGDACYENVLICGKEVHTHSEECYENPDELLETAAVATTQEGTYGISSDEGFDGAGTDGSGDPDGSGDEIGWTDSDDYGNAARNDAALSDDSSTGLTDPDNAADSINAAGSDAAELDAAGADALSEEVQQDLTSGGISEEENRYVPQLDPLFFNAVLNKHTGIYYYHVPEGETVEDSSLITDWKKVDKNTELGPNDLLRVYLSYTIPEGSLNETNPTASYRLPANLHLTDDQVNGINAIENGIAAAYIDYNTLTVTDPDNYHRYLGAEAVEGTRTPDQTLAEYLAQSASGSGSGDSGNQAGQEFISATVRAQNVYDTEGRYGEKGAYLGQDLVFTFSPYTIEKNQHTYDASGQPARAGEKVRGWFAIDFNLTQVDLDEPYIEEVENVENIEKVEGDSETNRENESADENADEYTDEITGDENSSVSEDGGETFVLISRELRTADIVFVEKDESRNLDEISTSIKVVTAENYEKVEANPDDAENIDNTDNTDNSEGIGEEQPEDNTEENEEDLTGQEAETGDDAAGADNEDKTDADAEEKKDEDKTGSQDDEPEKTIMPAMSFEDSIRVRTGKPAGVEDGSAGSAAASAAEALPRKAKVTVRVEADEGTFPAGTTMVLSAVEDLDAVAETVKETVERGRTGEASQSADSKNNKDNTRAESNSETDTASSGSTENKNPQTYGFQAVDISFRDADGNEIEPAKPVRVALSSEIVEQIKADKEANENTSIADPVVVHLDDEGNAEKMDLIAPEDVEPAQGKTEEELREEMEKAKEQKESDEQETDEKNISENDNERQVTAEDTDSSSSVSGKKTNISETDTAENESEEQVAGDEKLTNPETNPQTFDEQESLEQTSERTADYQNKKQETRDKAPSENSNVYFETDSFSVYAIVYTVEFHAEVISASGDTYEITVRYGEDARIPDGAELRVREILPEEEAYKSLQNKAGEKLAGDLFDAIPAHPVLFDISIVVGEEEIEPAAGSSVQVEVKLVKGSVTGTFSDEDSPVLINDEPMKADEQEITQKLQIIHDVDENDLDVVDIQEVNTEETIVGQFETESFSNWLVFLDEEVEEITIGRGDTITLRPYSQWVWNQQNTVNGQSVSWKMPQTGGHADVETKHYEDGQLNQEYDFYQLTATTNPGDFYVETTAGKRIHVIVQSEPVSSVPGTVDGLDTIKVNLFNYDKDHSLDVAENTARVIDVNWGETPSSYATDGINAGSALKFLGWGARNGSNRINNYQATTVTDNIVQGTLGTGTDGKKYPRLNGNGNTSLQYLFSAGNSDVDAYMGVTGLFRQDDDGYYYFNSNTNYARYNQSSNSFTLYEHTYTQATTRNNTSGHDENSKPIGFFPFHDYDSSHNLSPNHDTDLDHHFGISMEVKFALPPDKMLHKDDGTTVPIIFEFSGDDDMWVFVDNNLSLDVGGIHQPLTGSINFTNDSRFQGGQEYTLRIFYLERGGCDSNCSIRFNIPLTKRNFEFEKQDAEDKTKFIKGAKFQLFKDAACTKPAVNDTNGDYYIATSGDDGKVSFNTVSVGTYYMKEIEAPSGYKLDETIHLVKLTEDGVTIKALDENGQVVECDADSNRTGVQIANHENPDITVEKKWQDAAGSSIDPDNGYSATLKLQRYVKYKGKKTETIETTTDEPEYTLILHRSADESTTNTYVVGSYDFKRGTRATISWEYRSNYNQFNPNLLKEIKIGDGSWQTVGSSGSVSVDIPTGTDVVNVYLTDGWYAFNLSQGNPQINDRMICSASGTTGQKKTITTTQTVDDNADWAPDTEFNSNTVEEHPEQFINLPENDSDPWKGVFSNLTAIAVNNNYTYYYKYYVIETDASPSGFETLYYDSEDHQVLNPSSLQTDESTSQKIVNRELLDVPVEKHWADFGGEAYTWEVVFQLDRALMDVEHPVAEEDLVFEPVEGKYLTMSKGDENPKFEDLPMYCVDENGKIYRIHYSVVEKSYTVWRGAKTNENIVARWVDGDSTATIPEGVQYTPQFEQDAGEHGAAVDDYKIIIINNLQDLHLARETNLTVEKTWPAGTDYANSNTASATFELHRYVHEEHRDYRPYMVENWQWVDITIDTGNGNPQTIHVPSGYPLHLVGRMKSGQSAGTLAFTQTIGEGDPTTFGESQTTFDSNTGTFDLSFTANQTKTITLTSGSGSILGGADGIRLAAYNSKGTDTVDQNFVETFTLNKDEGWSTFFDDLPLVQEEKNVNPAIASQTIYVYSYYLVETNKTPANSQAIYTCDGEAVQSESGRYDLAGTQTLTAANTILGDLDITKTVRKNGTKDDSANGTFWYAVYDSEYDPNADPPQTPVRNGSITVVNGEGEVTEQDLPVGTYYVYELTGENGTPIVSGNNGTHKSINDTIYNVTGSGTTASVRDSSGDTESDTVALVNNRETTNKTGTKTWIDLKANTVHPTIYFRLFYRTSTGDIAVSGAEQKTLENGTTSVEWTDVPKYDENGVEYVYVVKEYVKNDHGDYIEAAPNGYISSEDGLNVTNTQSEKYEPTTGYSGRKIWADTANGGATRPSAINVTLMVDKTGDGQSPDDEVAKDINGDDCIISWPVDTGDVWEYSFGNLPVFDSSGSAIKYYAVEDSVEGYTPSADITATQYSYLQPDTTQYDPADQNIQVVNLTPSGNAARIINDANISLNAEISHLPYVAVKINAYNRNYHIWTARQLSQGEKTELIRVFNQALGTTEANINNTRFVDGLPVSKAADGNVEFLYRENVPRGSGYIISISKQGDETLKVQVNNHDAFDYILVGTLAYSYDEGKTDFTNTLKTEDYDVQKTWGAGKSAPEGTEVVITLKGTIPGEANDQNPNPDPVQVDLSAVGVSKTTATLNGGLEGGDDTTANPWIYSWQGLPQYDTAGNRITYSAEETSYKIDGVAVDLNTYAPVSSSDTTYELVVTNQIPTASFDIVKVAKGTSTRLSGATFTIRQVNKNSKTAQITYKDGSTESQPVTTGDDGKVSFTDVAIGYYEVKEKQQPAGYIIENDGDDTFYIKVDPEGVKLLKKVVEDGKLSLVEADGLVVNNVTVTSDGSSLEFIMENTPGAALPYTGGPGTNMLYFFGIMLTGLAGAGLVMKRRRRNVT